MRALSPLLKASSQARSTAPAGVSGSAAREAWIWADAVPPSARRSIRLRNGANIGHLRNAPRFGVHDAHRASRIALRPVPFRVPYLHLAGSERRERAADRFGVADGDHLDRVGMEVCARCGEHGVGG